MNDLIEALQAVNLEELTPKSWDSNLTYTEEEISALKEIERHSDCYVQDRLVQLTSIARMMQVASQDDNYGKIGCFEMQDVTNISFFLEEEFNSLAKAYEYNHFANHHLEQVKLKGGR